MTSIPIPTIQYSFQLLSNSYQSLVNLQMSDSLLSLTVIVYHFLYQIVMKNS